MPITIILLVISIVFIMIRSLLSFIRFKVEQIKCKTIKNHISVELFYTLIVIYCIAIIGFGLIYFLISLDRPIMLGYVAEGESLFKRMYDAIYFSGVTMLTIGYGDISPVNIGRFIAIVQALIGYILPTAFVLKLVQVRQG